MIGVPHGPRSEQRTSGGSRNNHQSQQDAVHRATLACRIYLACFFGGLANFWPLSAATNSFPTDCGTPARLAKLGLWATASIKRCCFVDLDGTYRLPT